MRESKGKEQETYLLSPAAACTPSFCFHTITNATLLPGSWMKRPAAHVTTHPINTTQHVRVSRIHSSTKALRVNRMWHCATCASFSEPICKSSHSKHIKRGNRSHSAPLRATQQPPARGVQHRKKELPHRWLTRRPCLLQCLSPKQALRLCLTPKQAPLLLGTQLLGAHPSLRP